MVEFSKACIAVRWTFFFILASGTSFEAYSPLFLKQLGFSSSDIALTILPMTIASPLLIPLIGFLADKYRVRKNVLYISILLTVVVFLAHLFPLVRYQNCDTWLANSTSSHDGQPSKTTREVQSGLTNTTSIASKTNGTPISTTWIANRKTERVSQFNHNVTKHSSAGMRSKVMFHAGQKIWRNPLSNKPPSHGSKLINRPVSILVGMIILRAIYDILKRMMVPLMNVAAIQQTRKVGTTFGSYRCWGDIGGSVSMFVVGILALNISYPICGQVSEGYFVTFICTAVQTSLSLAVGRFIVFEYLSHRVCGWGDIRQALFNRHFLFMIFISWFTGFCLCFQQLWEFWYIAELSGGPLIMGIGGLLREPFVATWFYLSGRVIDKLGELKTVCLALFLYAVSFMALSFVGIPWLVLVFDVFQSAGYAFSNSSLVVHFGKTGSLASSGVIQSIFNSIFYGFGLGSGGAIMGVLFNTIGSRTTLRCYSIAAVLVLALFAMYVLKAQNVAKYELVVCSASDDETESEEEK